MWETKCPHWVYLKLIYTYLGVLYTCAHGHTHLLSLLVPQAPWSSGPATFAQAPLGKTYPHGWLPADPIVAFRGIG